MKWRFIVKNFRLKRQSQANDTYGMNVNLTKSR